ncbi:MAG: hypothetical protein II007_08290 [Gammaproteobacteria bacterium]|nr:hypothetical protein [Gammaproteobacteria bacterium]
MRAMVITFVLLATTAPWTNATASCTEVTINAPFSELDSRYEYPRELLELVMAATAVTDGDCTVKTSPVVMLRERSLHELIHGSIIQVMAEATQSSWEEQLLTVRIPIRKGLQGYRLMMIRNSDQQRIAALNIDQLKQLPSGGGHDWTTTPLMRQAGFNMVAGSDYSSLFRMLDRSRIDTFARGVNEVFHEQQAFNKVYPGLTVDRHWLIYIPLPTYFFVTPRRPDLAERIDRGLRLLISDGRFDQLFMRYFGEDIRRAGLSQRQLIRIDNPNLSSLTPLDDSRLWLIPEDLINRPVPSTANSGRVTPAAGLSGESNHP